jgi:hypothetical protein
MLPKQQLLKKTKRRKKLLKRKETLLRRIKEKHSILYYLRKCKIKENSVIIEYLL